jgi:hypothetical protein
VGKRLGICLAPVSAIGVPSNTSISVNILKPGLVFPRHVTSRPQGARRGGSSPDVDMDVADVIPTSTARSINAATSRLRDSAGVHLIWDSLQQPLWVV